MIAQLTERLKQRVAPWIWSVVGRELEKTRPFPICRDAQVELHTMLSRNELVPYVVGMKSLLRFFADIRFAIVVHLDGAWTASERALLEHHFPGVRCIDETTARAHCESTQGRDSFATRQRSVYISWRRLIDTQFFRGCDRLINVDSDVLCLNKPTGLLNWIGGDRRPIVIGQTNGNATPEKLDGRSWHTPSSDSSRDGLPVQSQFLNCLPALSDATGLPLRFLDGGCAGLHGHHEELRIAEVQRLVEAAERLGIPMNKWGAEQSTVVYLLSANGGHRLDPNLNFNFFPEQRPNMSSAEIVHFIGLSRYHRWIYPRLGRRIIAASELAA